MTPDGYFVTAARVLQEYKPKSAQMTVGIRQRSGDIRGAWFDLIERDEAHDLALCKIAVPLRRFAENKSNPGTLRVHEYMQKKPLVGIAAVADELKLSIPTATVALDHLARLGIAKEITGKRRARIFGYSRYLKILSEGTEPIQH